MKRWLDAALELRDDSLHQHLAQLDSPLIERVEIPDDALREHAVFVERDELSECCWRQPLDEDRVRRAVALEDPMRNEVAAGALGLHLLAGFPESQRFGLCSLIVPIQLAARTAWSSQDSVCVNRTLSHRCP